MTTGTLRIGLRFDRRDRIKLRELARLAELKEAPGAKAHFEQAALAAETGEPLQVICKEEAEAHQLAARFRTYGLRAPTVEELFTP